MISPQAREYRTDDQKRIADELKSAGYSLSGCQLVMTDFRILEREMQEKDEERVKDRVQHYLYLCRNTRIQLNLKSKRHEFVDDTRGSVVSYKRLEYARNARYERRLNRTCANTCCMH